jgi:hypothetical protein
LTLRRLLHRPSIARANRMRLPVLDRFDGLALYERCP